MKNSSKRGANSVEAAATKLVSADGSRWACGRYAKAEMPGGRWEPVLVYTLKSRNAEGKVVTHDRARNEAAAIAWCGL